MGSLHLDFYVTNISAGTYKELSLPPTVPPTTPEASVLSACVLDAEQWWCQRGKGPCSWTVHSGGRARCLSCRGTVSAEREAQHRKKWGGEADKGLGEEGIGRASDCGRG